MPKTKQQKGEILRTLGAKISKSKSVVFAKFGNLTVKENEAIRSALRAENSEYLVAKKTLMGMAFKEAGTEIDIKSFDGRVAAVFGFEDEVTPARVIDKFKKSSEGKIDFLGGILENKILNQEEVSALAKLPSKQELYAKIVGSLNAPVSGFVNVLAGNLRGLVNVLNAVKDKKGV